MGKHSSLVIKVLGVYFLFLILGVIFIMPFYKHMLVYSFVIFLIFGMALYSEISDVAIKEKRPIYDIKTYIMKGFVVGLIAAVPLAIVVTILQLLNIRTTALNFEAFKQMATSAFLIPVYFVAKVSGKSLLSFYIAILFVPIFSGLGYLSGYLGFSVMEFLSEKFGINLQLKPKKKKR